MATQFTEVENPHWRRTFFPIWIGQALSLVGSRMVGFALIWYITESTGSAIVLTTLALVGHLPELILGPFAGALVDRWNRQKVMIIADGAIAFLTLVIALLFAFDLIQLWHIYILMFGRSIGGAFHFTAMAASTSLMVPKERFTKIQGINQLLQGFLAIIAAPLGALVIELMEIGDIMFIDVVSAAIAIAPLFFVTIPQPEIVTTDAQRANPIKTMFADVREGLRYVVKWKGLLYVLLLATGINAIVNPAFTLLPLLISDTFGLGAPALATIQTTLGIGTILGSLILSVWGGFKRKVYTSASALAASTIGLLLMAIAPVNAFWMLIVGIAIFALLNPIVNGPFMAIFQDSVDPNMQGRVFALIGTMAGAASPIGLMIAGPVSEFFGVQSWFLIGAVYTIFMSIMLFLVPAIRNLEDHPKSQHHPVAVESNS